MRTILSKSSTNKWGRRTQGGNIVIPVLFIVIAFAILLTSGQMFNISVVDLTEKFGAPRTSVDSSRQNLQIKDVKFSQLVPEPVGDTCDGSQQGYGKVIKKADMGTKACCYYHAYTDDCSVCCSGVCVDKDAPVRKAINPGVEPPPDAIYWCDAKPIIYLYPQVPTLVDVEVIVPGEIVVSDPLYPTGGWKQILAFPNGNFYYQKNQYKELFYEATVTPIDPPKHGVVVLSKDLEQELLNIIEKLGLRGQEKKDFVSYWAPKLKSYKTEYMLVSFFDNVEKQPIDKVIITPKPDTFIEFIMYFKPLHEPIYIDPIKYPQVPERIGFTAVEWGGVIDN